jgi:hypothetical protein
MMSASDSVIHTFEQAWESFVAEIMDAMRSTSGDLCLGQQVMRIFLLSNCRSE